MGKLTVGWTRFLLLCALGLILTLPVPTKTLAYGESISVSPSSGPTGQAVTIVGTGWHEHGIRGLDVPIWIGFATEVGRGHPDANGSFSVGITIPINPPPQEIVNGKLRISAIIGNGGSADAFYTLSAQGQLPDLSPTKIQFNPEELVPGKTVLFDSGVQNLGSQGTGVFNIRWFVDGVSVAYGGHSGVPVNSTVVDGNSQFAWLVAVGTHTIEFAIDVDNHVLESDETNNRRSVTVIPSQNCPIGQNADGYWYVRGYQCYTAPGVYAKMSQPQPHIDPLNGSRRSGHSLAQITASNYFSNGVDAIEVGWTVWPDHFHDDLPHLFVFRTSGVQGAPCDKHSGGCWAWEDNSGWVPYPTAKDAKYHPGDPVTVTSNPEQYGIYYLQGNWWVNYRNEWIGYFPAAGPNSPWPNNRFTQFTRASWWGEVSDPFTIGSCTHMGNGIYGSQPNSALITDMGFINSDGSQTQANATQHVTNPNYYDIGNFTGHSFTYGGSGSFFGLPFCQR